jgi:nitrate/TMAO reductase-like tetraheme cytochrome c subunit
MKLFSTYKPCTKKNLLIPLLILFSYITVPAQISPGDLTNAHAKLEGISNCTKCHVLGEQVNSSKCLDCHKEIKSTISLNKGYHSSSEVKGKECWSCHSEHNGRNFRIINFNPDKFDHDKTSFKLTGAHSKSNCSDCHQSKFITSSELKKRTGTYLGLNTNCISCHEDTHQGTLGSECSSCHGTETFKPAAKFNHDSSKFKLTGLHLEVKCIECHPIENRNGKEFQRFKGVAFINCNSCHKDIHRGKFGNECQSCHVTSSFKNINKDAINHDKTDFPLLGKHSLVLCSDCHKGSLSTKLKFQNCTDCHSDYHKGDFTVQDKLRDCLECHTVYGFQPSTFTIIDHNQSKFPLTGSHLAVPCQSCHYKNSEYHFKDIGLECINCHQNIHGNEISQKYMPKNNCSECHSTENWSKIKFDHDRTDFILLGKHLNLNCNSCHLYNTEDDEKGFKFSSLKSDCISCHKDIHFGQFSSGEVFNCERCHAFDNWKPVKFDHNRTEFVLEGAHLKLDCSRCHKQVEEKSNLFIRYKIKNFKCADCHS